MKKLNQCDIIYFVQNFKVRYCKYLCVHPLNEKYHILIDECQEPFRLMVKK